MNWNKHFALEGSHAFLSASGYHWINYSDEKLVTSYTNHLRTLRGTRLHEIASLLIKERIRQSKTKSTFNMFVNDAIGFNMDSEVLLYYSDNCFGTADAIYFGKQRGSNRMILRIHDLKTGETKAHIEQLLVYCALFCLEYKVKPGEIDIETRLYQYDDILIFNPTAEDVVPIMDKIIRFSKIMDDIKEREGN